MSGWLQQHRYNLCDGVIVDLRFAGSSELQGGIRRSEVGVTDEADIKQCALKVPPYLSCKFPADTQLKLCHHLFTVREDRISSAALF